MAEVDSRKPHADGSPGWQGEGEEELSPLVYAELRRIAARLMAGERAGHTLQATALVNEAYLRLADALDVSAENRRSFLAIAARSMRQVLVDHARTRAAQKRQAPGERLLLSELAEGDRLSAVDILAVEEALQRLAILDERKATIVELRFFTAMPFQDIAELLGVSKATVSADWSFARAWLETELMP